MNNYPKITFVLDEEGREGRQVSFREPVIKVGSMPSAHLTLGDADSKVGRMHAYIQVAGRAEVYISDLGSAYGTYVNGQRVNKAKLKTGDRVKFGDVEATVTIEGDEEEKRGKSATDAGRVRTSPFRSVAEASARPTFCERCFYIENALREMGRIDGRIQCPECGAQSGLSHAHATLLAGAQLQQAIKISAQLRMLDEILEEEDLEKVFQELGLQR